MGLLNFNEANCKHCYKCLRVCPVKAIKFKNDQAEIIEERCIACGQCFLACPQNARKVKSSLEQVKEAIAQKKKVIATVAPSFAGAFDISESGKFVAALKRLGFYAVEETAVGADVVSLLYKDYTEKSTKKNIITTACPSANELIEKYFPSLIKYMIPVVSPMVAHGKMIKYFYGIDAFVAFIGPCVAKKVEAIDVQHDDVIDAVLTFEEMDNWLKEEKIDLNKLEPIPFDKTATKKGKLYPVNGGVANSFVDGRIREKYDVVTVNGIEQSIETLKAIDKGEIEGILLEINVCEGGCVNGSGMPIDGTSYLKRFLRVKKYVNSEDNYENSQKRKIPEDLLFSKGFVNKSIEKPKASEEEIKTIMRKMGKFTPQDELNCSACGYGTCREKAQAVYEGMAEISMCMPFMKSKAERLSNQIFENSPNSIFIVDNEMKVVEFNHVSERIFKIKADDIIGKPISTIIDDFDFYKVKENEKNIILKKVNYPQYDVIMLQNILYIKEQDVFLVIMIDITNEEKNRNELKKVKENALNAAQDVIQKQMRVAQEIAGLLGETTAETKVILTKLKNVVLDDGDIK